MRMLKGCPSVHRRRLRRTSRAFPILRGRRGGETPIFCCCQETRLITPSPQTGYQAKEGQQVSDERRTRLLRTKCRYSSSTPADSRTGEDVTEITIIAFPPYGKPVGHYADLSFMSIKDRSLRQDQGWPPSSSAPAQNHATKRGHVCEDPARLSPDWYTTLHHDTLAVHGGRTIRCSWRKRRVWGPCRTHPRSLPLPHSRLEEKRFSRYESHAPLLARGGGPQCR